MIIHNKINDIIRLHVTCSHARILATIGLQQQMATEVAPPLLEGLSRFRFNVDGHIRGHGGLSTPTHKKLATTHHNCCLSDVIPINKK